MQYEAPKSVDAVVDLLAGAEGNIHILAGGTDLMVQMRADLVRPDLIVDIKKIPELQGITEENGAWRIGAAVTGAEMGEHARFKAAWPGVVEAVGLIGSTQVQGRATVAGNLCNASPAADSVPAMIAADAVVTIAGPDGRRDIAVQDFATGPGETCLNKGEMVIAFTLPARPPRAADAYLRITPRTEMDIAVVGAGVNLSFDDAGNCVTARVALGAVAERALLVPQAGQALIGGPINETALANLAAAASAACRPIDDKRGTKEYRIKTAAVLVRRAALLAANRAGIRT